jgi:hypothetical protein
MEWVGALMQERDVIFEVGGELAGISNINQGSRSLDGGWLYWAMGFTSSLL